MLDSPTKKRIDDARQILVGKVPDPKSQVEQITIALIYKFMDDMDRESEAMGGKASFFVKGYAKYSWRRIFAPKLSGAEQLKTYSEALEKLSLNEALPELFREIFKNAYLPYRDPETLRLFLKTIGEFEIRPLRAPGRCLRVSPVGTREPGRRGAVPHAAAHHRLHGRGCRSQEERDHSRSRLRHSGLPHLCLEAHPRGQHQEATRRRPQARRQDPAHGQRRRLRHIARHGQALPRQPLPPRLRAAQDLRVRQSNQHRILGRALRRHHGQSALHVAQGRHQAPPQVLRRLQAAAKSSSSTT